MAVSGTNSNYATSYPTLRSANSFLSNVEYIGTFIELGDVAMEMIQSSLEGQPLQFVFNDYRNYQYNYAIPVNTNLQVQFPIPAKFSSLKSLFVLPRDQGTGAWGYYPFSTPNFGMTEYYWRVGPTIMPAKAPNTYSEMYSEFIKAVGSMSDILFSPNIEKVSYQQFNSLPNTVTADGNSATNIGSCRFGIGIDLELYQASDKSSVFAGWNSNTDDIFCVMNYNTNNTNPLIIGNSSNGTTNLSNMNTWITAAAAQNMRFDAFAMFDSVLVFENGTAYVRY
jgi:hypothetical protein